MERTILPLPRRRRAQHIDLKPAEADSKSPPLLFSLPRTYEYEGHHHYHGHHAQYVHHHEHDDGETSDDEAFESQMVMMDDEDLLANKKKRKIPSSPSRTTSCSAMSHGANDRHGRMKRMPVSLSIGQRPPSGAFSFKCASRVSLYLQPQPNHEVPSKSAERRHDMSIRHKPPMQARRALRRANKKPEEEQFWMCEYCEYEAIFGEWPMALMRGYDAKEKRERMQRRERQRLLHKAKHKNRQRPPARRPPPPPPPPPPTSSPQPGGTSSSAPPKVPVQARTFSDPTPMNGYHTTTSKPSTEGEVLGNTIVAGKRQV